MRRHSTAFAAGVVALSFTVPASLTATPSAVIAGQPVRFDGGIPVDGCPRADAATLVATAAFFPPDGFGPSTTRDAAGSFTVTYTVPSSTPPGAYDIGVRCGGGLAPPSTRVTVGAPSPSTTGVTTATSAAISAAPPSTTASSTTASPPGSSAGHPASAAGRLPWVLAGVAAAAGLAAIWVLLRRRR